MPPPTWRSPLQRIEWLMDHSELGRSAGVGHLRLLLGMLMLVRGVVLVVEQFDHDRLSPEPAFVVVFSIFLFTNRLGSFGRCFVPIALGTLACVATSS